MVVQLQTTFINQELSEIIYYTKAGSSALRSPLKNLERQVANQGFYAYLYCLLN